MKAKIKKVFTRYPELQQVFVDKKLQKVSVVRQKGYTILTRKEFEGGNTIENNVKTQYTASLPKKSKQ